MAILNANVMHLANEVSLLRTEVCARLNDHESRMRAIEAWDVTSQEKWRTHEEDHKDINKQRWAADVIGSVAAALASIFVVKAT